MSIFSDDLKIMGNVNSQERIPQMQNDLTIISEFGRGYEIEIG